MARTMYSDQITRSDAFLSMPVSARELYFQLLSDADNDGFIDNTRSIIRMLGASNDDYSLLVARKFIIEFQSGVIVIKHWRIHNLMRMDRYKPTVYQKELALLDLKENKAYTLREIDINLFSEEIKQIDSGLQNGNQMATSGYPNISKDKLSKVNKKEIDKEKVVKSDNQSLYGEFKNVSLSDEEYQKLQTKYPNIYESYIEKLSNYLAQKGKRYKSHYATIQTWIRNDKGVNDGKQTKTFTYIPRDERGTER